MPPKNKYYDDDDLEDYDDDEYWDEDEEYEEAPPPPKVLLMRVALESAWHGLPVLNCACMCMCSSACCLGWDDEPRSPFHLPWTTCPPISGQPCRSPLPSPSRRPTPRPPRQLPQVPLHLRARS